MFNFSCPHLYTNSANTSDLVFIAGNEKKDQLTELFQNQKEVVDFERSPCLFVIDGKYRGEQEKEGNDFTLYVGAMEENRAINKIVADEKGPKKHNSVLLPYYFKVSYSYEIGDKIYLTLGEHDYKFEVMGFSEDPLFASPLNINVYKIYITQNYKEELIKKEEGLSGSQSGEYKVKLKTGASSKKFDDKVSALITNEIGSFSGDSNVGLNWETMHNGGTIMLRLSMGTMLVFACLIILISWIITRFSIHNFINENLRNIGILKASGYTSLELAAGTVVEMLILSLLGIPLGLLLGYGLSGVIGNFQASMLGLRWSQGFDPAAAVVAALMIVLITFGITLAASLRYRKIMVLDALRGGIRTHNFQKNHISLDKTSLPLSCSLGLKNIWEEKLKNLSILLIATLLAFASCTGFTMYENFALNKQKLLQLAGYEEGQVGAFGDSLDAVGKEVKTWEEVEEVFYYDACNIKLAYEKNQTTLTCDFWKEPKKLKNEMVIEGRLPQQDNEIVVTGSIARELGAGVGDVIYAQGTGKRRDFIISGIDQKINNMGLKALMNFDGAARLNGKVIPSQLYIFTKEGTAYTEISGRLAERYPELKLVDLEKSTDASIATVALGMKLICAVFVVITIAVVSMVVTLLIRTKIIREKKHYGIYKALGFTTGQLILQTMISSVAVIFIGSVIGVTASCFLTDSMISACLSFCGIKKCNLTVGPAWVLLTVAGITILSALVSFLFSFRIRKIEPVKMLTED